MLLRHLILTYLVATAFATPFLVWYHLPAAIGITWLVGSLLFNLPAVIPNNTVFGPVVTSFQTPRREVWLTIDDGPHPHDTPKMLDLLARHQARATFFLIGQHAARHPELVREILRQGHTVGNHTFTHPKASFWIALPSRLRREIDHCSEILTSISPETRVHSFRAPVGMANLFLHSLLRHRTLPLIGWSSRGFDSVWTDPQKIVDRIWEGVSPGAIILLHEGNHPPDLPSVNPRSLELLLDRLRLAGYATTIPDPVHLE